MITDNRNDLTVRRKTTQTMDAITLLGNAAGLFNKRYRDPKVKNDMKL